MNWNSKIEPSDGLTMKSSSSKHSDSEASKMLEAALQQMDGIISSKLKILPT